MRDFPNFTTDYGASGLVLREIPYRQTAYIHIGTVAEGFFKEHLQELVSFCRAAGADRIFASGHPELESYPVHSQVIRMCGPSAPREDQIAALFPVTESTAHRWRELYNQRMAGVDHARTLEYRDEKLLAAAAGIYFIHRNGQLLGIGWMDGTQLLAMASVVPGEGQTVLATLMTLTNGEDISLEVASTNHRAVALYERMGLCKTAIMRQWHQIL